MPFISAIIPVKNGEATLEKCLAAIRNQTIADDIEIIVLDSASTDNSVAIAKSFGAKIININPAEFNHGLTRNEGVKYATGEFIYFTVQDAYLAENNQLEKMASYFADIETQSVTGMQAISNDLDKNPAMWFRRFSKPIPEIKQFPANTFQNFSPKKQLENCYWDNVNAMYRRSALQIIPFRKTDFAEDALWAKDALQHGWKIIRDSSLVVYHYHHASFNYNFRAVYILNYTYWKEFKVLPEIRSPVIAFTKNVYTLIKRTELPISSKVKWSVHNLSGLSGSYLSAIIFKIVYLFGRKNMLDKSYHLFCSKIPQGLQNNKL